MIWEKWQKCDRTNSYSQKPNVDTRFQLITEPTVDKIFFIIASGARSLIFPTKTVITGPAVPVTGWAPVSAAGFAFSCAFKTSESAENRKFVFSSFQWFRAYTCF